MFERFTTAARSAVIGAQTHARQAKHREIGAVDLLAAVLDDSDGVPARVLRDRVSPSPTEPASPSRSPTPRTRRH